MISRLLALMLLCSLASVPTAFGWDYPGHRVVNQLALASLPVDFPSFVRTPEARERIAFLSGEPDRWRNLPDPILRHINPPDHFLDLEEVAEAGIDPGELSPFRYTFTVQLAAGRAAHPENFPAIDPAKDRDRTRELIGFLPWTIAESYEKLKSEFSYLKAFELHGTPVEIANARADVIYTMGVMGHYVGDAAQPLHTTKYFNGWVGPNPRGFTTRHTFHAWIDGGFFEATGGIHAGPLLPRVQPARLLPLRPEADGRSPVFDKMLAYLRAQNERVVPLYQLEKDGMLDPASPRAAEGRAFLEHQLLVAGHMLGSLWLTAWREAPVDTYLDGQLVRRQQPDRR